MSTNKNATIRYQALDRCFRNPGRRADINSLVDACNEALLDIDPASTGIKKRQIYDDIKFMKDSRGYDAPIIVFKEGRRSFYRYEDSSFSINNQPLNEQEAQQLRESLLTLSRFKGMPQFEWVEEIKVRLEQSFNLKTNELIISFEENPFLKGRDFISDLYNAIVNKQVIKLEYKPFNREKSLIYNFHPYHLKQYNNRWFLIGKTADNSNITNIALDRIVDFKILNEVFQPLNIDFEERFEDVIGVSIPHDSKPQKILIKVLKNQWNYIKTKPLHGSQKIKKESADYTIIEIEVHINHELQSLLLSFGEMIEVLEPLGFRELLASRINLMKNQY